MKKSAYLIMICLLNSSLLFAQVAINTDGSTPDNSAMFDVKSTTKGVLLPRMTLAELNAIPNPADGLLVYCTDCRSGGAGFLFIFMAGAWYKINADCYNPSSTSPGTHLVSPTQIIWNWNPVVNASGYKWNVANDFGTATDVGTNTSTTETDLVCLTPYTRYVWVYSDCGVSFPTVLSEITTGIFVNAPIAGAHIPSSTQIVWNWNTVEEATGYRWGTSDDFGSAVDVGLNLSFTETGLSCFAEYTRYVWAYRECGISTGTSLTQTTTGTFVTAPTAGTHVATQVQIVWNWNTVPDATGYSWNTVDDFATSAGMGSSTTKTETGLTCNTPYTRYAWAYNDCGYSAPVTMTKSTPACWICGDPFTINHVSGSVAPVNKTVTYGTVMNIPGEPSKCWITSNLGADHQATAVNDATEPSAGWYWQFNRMQGYKHTGSVRTPNTTWISSISENSDWLTANDPCALLLGTGWRLPTSTEWTNVDATGGWTNWNGPWSSALKMHAAGYLWPSDGSLYDRGSYGVCWSSSQDYDSSGWYLGFYSGGCDMSYDFKAFGFSGRCLRD